MPPELRDSVRLGYLRVPRDHADPTGPTQRMAFAIVPAISPSPAPDPVVFIVGGPGFAGIEPHLRVRLQGPHSLDVLRDERDLIVFDQRGNGLSQPRTCPELAGPTRPQFATDPDAPAERAWRETLASCRQRLLGEGVRLDTLSSVQVAHDLEWLRVALGVPQLNLVGASYGSRIAAETVRQFPAAIRAVYFTGPVPPGEYSVGGGREQADVLLHTLFQRCAERPECRAAYPRLAAEYDAVLTRLREAPLRLGLAASDLGAQGEVLVDARVMRDGLADLLLNRDRAAGVPLLIHTIYEHGDRFLTRMGSHLARSIADDPGDAGTQLAFWCNDGSVNRADDLLQQRCRAWLGEGWDHPGAEPLQSDVPSLVATGELDPRTPPAYAHALASGLTRAHLLIAPWYGHEAPSACVQQITRDFMDAPEQAPDTACLDSIPPIPFVTGIVYSDWVGAAVARTWQRPWLAGLPGPAALLLILSAVGIPARHLRGRPRSRPGTSRSTWLSLLLASLVGITFIAALAAAVMAGGRRHVFVPAIGLPEAWAWVLALPWVLLALTLVAVLLALRARAAGHALGVPGWSAVIGSGLLTAVWIMNLLV